MGIMVKYKVVKREAVPLRVHIDTSFAYVMPIYRQWKLLVSVSEPVCAGIQHSQTRRPRRANATLNNNHEMLPWVSCGPGHTNATEFFPLQEMGITPSRPLFLQPPIEVRHSLSARQLSAPTLSPNRPGTEDSSLRFSPGAPTCSSLQYHLLLR